MINSFLYSFYLMYVVIMNCKLRGSYSVLKFQLQVAFLVTYSWDLRVLVEGFESLT